MSAYNGRSTEIEADFSKMVPFSSAPPTSDTMGHQKSSAFRSAVDEEFAEFVDVASDCAERCSSDLFVRCRPVGAEPPAGIRPGLLRIASAPGEEVVARNAYVNGDAACSVYMHGNSNCVQSCIQAHVYLHGITGAKMYKPQAGPFKRGEYHLTLN
eukprot:TRINITY_DN12860_c0_g1_i1.p1 TRINITY_DN12860_c0_g1~~TRINITY_DN12860_c0_g1_i1.p1  ORF type:complete len:174 (+),score=35.85 TRINITY_DN12860_c0_g1_i1:57-524(+)